MESAAEILAGETRGWWSSLHMEMKPTVGPHLPGMQPTEYWWSQLHICVEPQSIEIGCSLSYNSWLNINIKTELLNETHQRTKFPLYFVSETPISVD